jgi:hypothetical protein
MSNARLPVKAFSNHAPLNSAPVVERLQEGIENSIKGAALSMMPLGLSAIAQGRGILWPL